jgi:hypothetical protein
MSGYSDRFRFRLLGISRELDYLPSEAEQRRAYRAVKAEVEGQPLSWLAYAAPPIAFPLIGWLIVAPVGRSLGVGVLMPPAVFNWVAMTGVGLFLGYGMVWLMRRRFQRALRRRLSAEGVPTCLKCGYNRTGTASDAPCPECGHAPAAAAVS